MAKAKQEVKEVSQEAGQEVSREQVGSMQEPALAQADQSGAKSIEELKVIYRIDEAIFVGLMRKNRWGEGKMLKPLEFERKLREFMSQRAR